MNKKIDAIEEKHYVLEDMSKDTFDKFYTKYSIEKEEIQKALGKLTPPISNLKRALKKRLYFLPNSMLYGLEPGEHQRKTAKASLSIRHPLF